MFPCILEMMRKVLPGWEGMIFFKDPHSHYSFFFLWLTGKKKKRDFVAKGSRDLVPFLHWRYLCVLSPF